MKTLLFIILSSSLVHAINSQSYFRNTYAEAQIDFLGRAQALAKAKPTESLVSKESFQLPDGKNYEINYFFIGNKNIKNLIVIQSGTHGIEGHTGSGVQNFILDYLQLKKTSKVNFLFIHGINPYGFTNNRRVNYKNVDLNRNFVIETADFKSENPGYSQINDFLNPSEVLEVGFFTKAGFIFSAVKLILKHSKDTLKRAILKGQYNHPKGLYYGGKDYEPEFYLVNKIWDKFTPEHDKILLIDIHTGYGEKNKLHLLANSSKSGDSEELKTIFNPYPIDFGDDKEFYQVKGDLTTYFHKKYSANKKVFALAFEYGTLDSQKLYGSMDSLYRMVSENKGFNNGYKTDSDKTSIEKLFSDMFYPKDFTWRDSVIAQTKTTLDKALDYFEK